MFVSVATPSYVTINCLSYGGLIERLLPFIKLWYKSDLLLFILNEKAVSLSAIFVVA